MLAALDRIHGSPPGCPPCMIINSGLDSVQSRHYRCSLLVLALGRPSGRGHALSSPRVATEDNIRGPTDLVSRRVVHGWPRRLERQWYTRRDGEDRQATDLDVIRLLVSAVWHRLFWGHPSLREMSVITCPLYFKHCQ